MLTDHMKLLALSRVLALSVCFAGIVSTQIRQKRAWIIDSFSIEEEYAGPYPYVLGNIPLERSYLVNFWLKGSGVDEEPTGILSIDNNKGIVYVHKKIDFEAYQVLRLTFEARNVSNKEVDTRLGVEVKILDVNDNSPVFQQSVYEVNLHESAVQGEKVITVMATDNDDSTTPNGTFSLKIKSVTPKTDNVEFFIEQVENTNTGTIYFRGCLEYEMAQKYTILIEAKDHGNKIQLSSTATVLIKIIDKNNHLPEITSQTGPGTIPEHLSRAEVLYLQVTDKDSHGSAAWKAKFQIKGDKENYFEIKTDPTTNKGILSVVKPMDYELETSRNLSVSVENEVPYFSCEITGRPNQRLWNVKTVKEGSSLYLPKLYPITIGVIDVNDPPEFVPRVKEVMIMENSATGTYLYTLKAIDPDKTFASKFHYAKGQDVDNWVNIDSKTGKVTTAKVLDRESPLLKNSTYTVLTYAVDNGVPPSTGTGTLVIHVGDENDNVPVLDRTSLVMCLSEGPTTANLTATDQDLPPFGGPFTYELQGDVKRRWKMDPNFGTTVNLVKENTVYSGVYKVPIKTSDNQGRYAIQNLTVTVCDCTISASCHLRRMSGSHIAFSAMGIIVLAALLLLAMLLLAILISCKNVKKMIPTDEDAVWHLITSNIETLGTDCMLPVTTENDHSRNRTKDQKGSGQNNGRFRYRDSEWEAWMMDFNSTFQLRQNLIIQIGQNILRLKATDELTNYSPHCYAEEGELEKDFCLDDLSIAASETHLDDLSDLDQRFNKLAAICKPDLISQI
ncbi:cadherin-like protein 26 [Electrophorus electricus]|uniref:cadherin-like protein 26 n=1 Tax=Electrophorus electricus TaxID=8005 RepID=UPI0015D0409B|nr:cadherin-like protein 26 [Electrophorus electricus]